MDLKSLSLAELKASNGTIFEAVMSEAMTKVEESTKIAKYKKNSEEVLPEKIQEVETLKKTVEETEKERDGLKDEIKTLKEQIAKHDAERLDGVKLNAIAEVQKEVGLTDEQMTEVFREDINRLPFEADKVDDFKAAVKVRMEERKALPVQKKKVVENAGTKLTDTTKKTDEKKVTETEKLALSLKSGK
jgi:seryl-tRNA synthetase